MSLQEMSSECTDETGKVLKHSSDNPFIEQNQQQTVVDMKGTLFFCIAEISVLNENLNFRRDGAERHNRASGR
jgi:hypothetical protein